MSIIYKIPHSSLFHPTSNIFTAYFNNPTLGKYNFDNNGNKNVRILELQKGSIYLLERISLAGSISQELYLESINTLPILRLKRERDGSVIYKRDIPLVNYIDNQEVICWVDSKKDNDFLTADVYGILEQLPDMVELSEIRLNINFSVFQIRDQRALNVMLGAEGDKSVSSLGGY